jgi:secondary thiamine-phosphate synthase enzyme
MVSQKTLQITTRGRTTVELTGEVAALVRDSGIRDGLCHVFVQHTSASLMLCENADPTVRADMESFMARIAPDGDPLFRHDAEGPDDMPAHVRSVLTGSGVTVPVCDAACVLGTWQGIFLWEHRHRGYTRKVTVTVIGE